MATYDVAIYQTYHSEQNHGAEPLDRLKEYIEGAFTISDDSVNLSYQTQTPDPPTEDPTSGFTGRKPCGIADEYFSSLSAWFGEWLQCSGNFEATNANLLLSNYCCGEGLASSSNHAATGGAGKIINAPSNYTSKIGTTSRNGGPAMSTALHELGHCLLDWSIPNGGHHNTGQRYTNSSGNSKTPMGTNGSENYCDKSVPNVSYDDLCMFWSLCCDDNWDPTS